MKYEGDSFYERRKVLSGDEILWKCILMLFIYHIYLFYIYLYYEIIHAMMWVSEIFVYLKRIRVNIMFNNVYYVLITFF